MRENFFRFEAKSSFHRSYLEARTGNPFRVS